MNYYADVVESRDLQDIGARLGEIAGRLADEQARGRQAPAADLARDGLILAGMREQAIADRCPAGPAVLVAQQGTDWWADQLMRATLSPSENGSSRETWSSRARSALNCPEPATHLFADLGKLPTIVPEGYLFYGLFPEVYGILGQSLASGWTGRPVVVVGVRSIGTSLSAAVAAGLRLSGCPVVRHTVRPTGDPFQRELVPDRALLDQWRQAAARGDQFVAVDEGPGLSGSSLAAVVEAFRRQGAEQVTILCADPPNHLPQGSDAVRRLWETTSVHPARPLIEAVLQRTLAGLLSDSTGLPFTVIRDLSWGDWSITTPPVLPGQERRKLLLWDGERQVLAKFVGFGEIGLLKARLAQRLGDEALSPTYRGFAHGFLLLNWEGNAAVARQAVLDAAPRYYAYLRCHCPAEVGIDFGDLARIVADTSTAWLGDSRAGLVRRLAGAVAGADPRALIGDQRPEPGEWIARGAAIVKCDAADHFLDHSWARRQDIAFDLAGFLDLWAITDRERQVLLASYVSQSADPGVYARLPFFRAVFAAHRLAMLDTAYHAGESGTIGAVEAERSRMGQILAAALTEQPDAPCASS